MPKPENLTPGLKPGQERDPETGKIKRTKPVLGEGRVPDVEAMEYVTSHGGDATHQQAYFRRLMEKEPKWFADRLRELQRERDGAAERSGVTGVTPGPAWDGTGACPTCGREPESDDGPEDVELLIEQLLAREVGDGDVQG